MPPARDGYEALYRQFAWSIPARYNIGVDVCDRWAAREPGRTALIQLDPQGRARRVDFATLRAQSNRLANALRARGVAAGDRVAVFAPQSVETAIAHIAVYKLGAIAVPLFPLFGPEALIHRLGDAGVCALVADAAGAARIAPLRGELPALRHVFAVGAAETPEAGAGVFDLYAEMAAQADVFAPVDTAAEDPALIIYTSGTTGPPKGALHAHRVLLGHLPGVEMSHGYTLGAPLGAPPGAKSDAKSDAEGAAAPGVEGGGPDARAAPAAMWTPADWAWIGGLLDVLLPALRLGVPVLAHRFAKFTGEAAFRVMAAAGVGHAFLPPTALKTMRAATRQDPALRHPMRSVASGGESLGPELLRWGREVFGTDINEFYGQTECNMIVSSCAAVMPPRPGAMGRAAPGHVVRVIDAEGRPRPDGAVGDIAVKRPDPVMFLRYWGQPEATAAKFRGDWLVTGDVGVCEGDGWLRFVGRDDDVITSSGYRIGPGEVEDCLIRHPAVRMAGVVGKPDPERTEIVKAFIVLNDDAAPSDALKSDIADFVKTRLAAHEYPREIEFTDALPMTVTGKIIRRALRDRG